MPLQATSGAASYDGFGGGVAAVPQYIEEVFSTYLYAGNSSTQTITNNIDLSTKGGLVWVKDRSATSDNGFYDTTRGVNKVIYSNLTNAESTLANSVTAFGTTGFSLGTDSTYNWSGDKYASWTFRKQPKMFDIQTWTGTGGSRTITTALNGTTGCIILKRTDSADQWWVVHRSGANGFDSYGILNQTGAFTATGSGVSSVTDTSFTVTSYYNGSGATWVAYIFAHDAGGFGLTGTDNVISCGSFTTDGSGNATVSLGYEPQWVMTKRTDSTGNWWMMDTMRGMPIGSNNSYLLAEESSAEASGGQPTKPNATGFSVTGTNSSATFIYIAIRRGPMKVPTTGTSVFTPATRTGDGATSVNVTNATFPVDLVFGRGRSTSAPTPVWIDRLRGATRQLRSDNTDEEAASTIMSSLASQTGWIGSTGGSGSWNTSSVNYIQWYFRRAPGFFDEVCYTGTGSARTVSHNLAAVPELMIVKNRSTASTSWVVYSPLGPTKILTLNTTNAESTFSNAWNDTAPTDSVFTVGIAGGVNTSAATYVAYLFATCAGVSKVGTYTGTGTTLQINCGFTAGARFVLIKRTDSTGDWYVWDTARGIVAGNDSYLLLNSTAAEVTSTDYIDTYSAGFEISSTAPAAINANGGSFIFFAVA